MFVPARSLTAERSAGVGNRRAVARRPSVSEFVANPITSPLIHLWSLGVEEQYYLMWPLFLLATWRLGKGQFGMIVTVAVISFTLNVAAISSNPLASFYLPWNRLWELCLGGALAHAQLRENTLLDRTRGALSARWPWLAWYSGPC